MKKIVFAVYHDCNQEARSMELLHCCCILGHVDFVSYSSPAGISDITVHLVDKRSPVALLNFLQMAEKTIDQVRPDLVVLHDSDCSALIPFLRKRLPDAKIIYDSSELNIPMRDMPKQSLFRDGLSIAVKQKFTSFRGKYEREYLKYADVVLAANVERAQIMKEYYHLKELPIIFDNIHKIEDDFDRHTCEIKYGYAFDKQSFNILFAGGINEERKTFDYIKAFRKLGDRYRLILVGSASAVALKQYQSLVQDIPKNRIFYLGFLSRADLRFCIQHSQASVVLFDKNSYNTLYCASGKCYESLFEGVPILASENPPLKRLCTEFGIGVSDDCFERGVLELQEHYTAYTKNVREYVDGLHYKMRVLDTADAIERRLNI